MPAHARTSVEQIVAAGRTVLEAEGLDGLTMQAVAMAVGVRPPSLYKRLRDRGDLIRLIATDVADELGSTVEAVATGHDARADLRAIASAYRAYAHAHPQAFDLLNAPLPEAWRPDTAVTVRSSAAILRVAGALAGPGHALEAARTAVAWANGFVRMELSGAFRLGGDVDAAFSFGLEHLTEALAAD